MRRISPADSPLLILPDLDALARKTFFVIRESPKMDPSTFLRTLSGAVSSGFASRNQIAMGLSRRTGVTITGQAVHDRFSEASTEFLTAVLRRLFGQRVCSGLSGGNPGTLRRIPVEDSSVQTMPKANAELFPAHGNRHGGTAGMKIDFACDLLAGEVVSHTLESATEQDKTIGKELVAMVRENDLALRDMGCFSRAEFVEIERRGAWWLTRVPLTLGLRSERGKTLERLLQSHCGNVVDVPVKAGEAGDRHEQPPRRDAHGAGSQRKEGRR